MQDIKKRGGNLYSEKCSQITFRWCQQFIFEHLRKSRVKHECRFRCGCTSRNLHSFDRKEWFFRVDLDSVLKLDIQMTIQTQNIPFFLKETTPDNVSYKPKVDLIHNLTAKLLIDFAFLKITVCLFRASIATMYAKQTEFSPLRRHRQEWGVLISSCHRNGWLSKEIHGFIILLLSRILTVVRGWWQIIVK